jgi:hypothetical protein
MKLKNILIAAMSTIAPLLTLLPPVTPIATAQNPRPNPTPLFYYGDCSARVVGREPGTQVNMRSMPNTNSEILAFVLVGQNVTFLSSSSRARVHSNSRDDQDNTWYSWYYVEYEPSRTRGWIRADFLSSPFCDN